MSHLQCLQNQNNITDSDLTLLWFRLTDFFMHKGTDGSKRVLNGKWVTVWGVTVSWWFTEGAKGNSREKIVGHHQAKASIFDHLGFSSILQMTKCGPFWEHFQVATKKTNGSWKLQHSITPVVNRLYLEAKLKVSTPKQLEIIINPSLHRKNCLGTVGQSVTGES